MTIATSSYESKVSEAIVGMLAGAATFRTLVVAATPTLAKGFIVEDWGGEEGIAVDGSVINPALAWASVRLLPTRRVPRADLDTWGYEGGAVIVIHRPTLAADVAPDAFRRARNDGGDIANEMQGQLGAAGCLLWATFDLDEITLAAATSAERGVLRIPITVAWRDIP